MTQEIFYRNAIGTREEDGSISISSDRPIDMVGSMKYWTMDLDALTYL